MLADGFDCDGKLTGAVVIDVDGLRQEACPDREEAYVSTLLLVLFCCVFKNMGFSGSGYVMIDRFDWKKEEKKTMEGLFRRGSWRLEEKG